MSKAMLIMDMPECCEKCDLCVLKDDYISTWYECVGKQVFNGLVKINPQIERKLLNKRQDWCPLREVPEKMEVCGRYTQKDGIVPSYKIGWNACIDEILGGEK